MAKTSAILLSIALTVFSGGIAMAQGRALADPLDAIYDQINAQAAASNAQQLPVRDRKAYDQFMKQTSGNLNVEYGNTARAESARSIDAMTTGSYEQKRINELAEWEKTQLQNNPVYRGRGRRSSYSSNSAAASDSRQIEEYRTRGLNQSRENINNRLQSNADLARQRDQEMQDVANNLREQVLSTQSAGDGKFGLQGVGTNLYVRQYGKPDANLPPVRGAAARIVPAGGGE